MNALAPREHLQNRLGLQEDDPMVILLDYLESQALAHQSKVDDLIQRVERASALSIDQTLEEGIRAVRDNQVGIQDATGRLVHLVQGIGEALKAETSPAHQLTSSRAKLRFFASITVAGFVAFSLGMVLRPAFDRLGSRISVAQQSQAGGILQVRIVGGTLVGQRQFGQTITLDFIEKSGRGE